jgi:O-antigen/teichoic acid export membrane protein
VYGLPGVLSGFIGVLMAPIYTRVFSTAEFGLVSLVNVFGALVSSFVVLSLDNSAARWFYDTEDPDHRRATISSWFWCQLLVGTLFATCIIGISPFISQQLLGTSEHAYLFCLTAIGIPFHTGSKVFASTLRYQRQAKLAVLMTISQILANVGLVLLFIVILRQGVQGLFVAQLLCTLGMGCIGFVGVRSWVSPRMFSWERLRAMLKYALPLIPAAIAVWMMTGVDRIMLGKLTNTSEVGLYSVSAAIAGGVALITSAFGQAWGPFAFSIIAQPESKRVYAKVLELYSFLGCGLCAVLGVFAPLILRVIATENYYPAASTVGPLALCVLLNSSRNIGVIGCGIAKKSVPTAYSIAIGAGLTVVFNLCLIPLFGRNGAAIGTASAWAGSVVYLFWVSQKNYPIPYRWKFALAPLCLSIAILVITYLLGEPESIWDYIARGSMLLAFVPLGMIMGMLNRSQMQAFFFNRDRSPEGLSL